MEEVISPLNTLTTLPASHYKSGSSGPNNRSISEVIGGKGLLSVSDFRIRSAISALLRLQRLFTFSCGPAQFSSLSIFVALFCNFVSGCAPVAPEDEFFECPVSGWQQGRSNVGTAVRQPVPWGDSSVIGSVERWVATLPRTRPSNRDILDARSLRAFGHAHPS